MNLLLLDLDELAPPGDDGRARVALTDRRAEHVRTVLRARPGSVVRVGVVGRELGRGEVLELDEHTCTLAVTLEAPPPPRLPVRLILAVPRPKVLLRTVAIAASFGVERLDLTNSWRVDKSYLGSPALSPASLARAARDGAEQGVTTLLPELVVHRRLMAMFDALPAATAEPERLRVVAHPGGPAPLEAVARPGQQRPILLAMGPEGGFLAREVETFERHGFSVVTLGPSVLRVEAAVAAALGQLVLLRRMVA